MIGSMLAIVAATAFGGYAVPAALSSQETELSSDLIIESDVVRLLGRLSFLHLLPPELQFSCARLSDDMEDDLAKMLADGKPAHQLAAARELWERRSRRQAANVIKYLSGSPPGGEEFRRLQREVHHSLQPVAILHEMERGEYGWGAWLAFLRPHADLVPALLAAIDGQPKWKPETLLALGNSGDARALEPLLKALKSTDYQTSGHAANALRYFGSRSVEPQLIEALAEGNTWRQVNAIGALRELGSRHAIPALEVLASDNRFTGVFNLKRASQSAIDRINQREAE